MGHDHRLISVRKLAALDIVFHGPRLILLEFAFGLGVTASLGLWLLYRGLAPGPNHSLVITVLGCALVGIGLNYAPLLRYALTISRQKSAQKEVATELANLGAYRKMYGLQSVILILVPCALLILAIVQAAQGPKTNSRANIP